MRFSVQHGLQNALFRRVRFSSPAQTPTPLTQKRILAVGPHAKAHSDPGASRKSAFWPRHLTENRTLAPAAHGKAHSACVPSPKDALCIPATATKNRCNPSSPQRDPSAVRPGETWRGERPSSCGGATDPHPYPYLHPQRPVPCASKTPGPALGIGLH